MFGKSAGLRGHRVEESKSFPRQRKPSATARHHWTSRNFQKMMKGLQSYIQLWNESSEMEPRRPQQTKLMLPKPFQGSKRQALR
jgi:hypothetical protein